MKKFYFNKLYFFSACHFFACKSTRTEGLLLICHISQRNQFGSCNKKIGERKELTTGSRQPCLLCSFAWTKRNNNNTEKSNNSLICPLSENQPTDLCITLLNAVLRYANTLLAFANCFLSLKLSNGVYVCSLVPVVVLIMIVSMFMNNSKFHFIF